MKEKEIKEIMASKKEIKEMMASKAVTSSTSVLAKLPIDWLAHMLMLHGFIHRDDVATAGSVKGVTWLNDNRPEGCDEVPEVASCLLANVILFTGCTLEEMASFTEAEWKMYIEDSIVEQDIVDEIAKKFVSTERGKLMAESGYALAPKNWDEVKH